MAEEITLKKSNEFNEKVQLFRLFFLKNDEEKSVEIVEVEEIDFIDVLRRLENSEFIFISPKRRRRKKQVPIKRTASKKDPSDWYFTHL